MTMPELLEALRAARITLSRDGGLVIAVPAKRVTPEFGEAIRSMKPQLLAALAFQRFDRLEACTDCLSDLAYRGSQKGRFCAGTELSYAPNSEEERQFLASLANWDAAGRMKVDASSSGKAVRAA